jgi:hypothetical protein
VGLVSEDAEHCEKHHFEQTSNLELFQAKAKVTYGSSGAIKPVIAQLDPGKSHEVS